MSLPSDSRLDLEQQRKRAKDLRRAHREGSAEAAVRIARHLPRARRLSTAQVLAAPFTLSEAQLVVAREAGFPSWPALKHALEGHAAPADRGEAVIDAAFAGDDAAVRAALERDPGLRRSLPVAAAVADAEAALALLAADPSLADRRSGRREWTPFLYLCVSRHRRDDAEATEARLLIARRLLELGADPNASGREPGFTSDSTTRMFDDHEWSPLTGAAGRVASLELVRLLIGAGAAPLKTSALLSQAVRGGKIEVLRLLLELAPRDWYQVIWALQASIVLDRTDMARMLANHAHAPTMLEPALDEAIRLERGPEVVALLLGDDRSELSGPMRVKAYRQAVRHGQSAVVELLRGPGAGDSAVTLVDRVLGACMNRDRGLLRRLLEDPSYQKDSLAEKDHRLLSWAIGRHRDQAVPLLLEAGLDPRVPDNQGETPLHLAVRAGSLPVVEALLEAGANVDARNFDAQTPLELALALEDASAREGLTRRLLGAGASPAHLSQFAPRTDRADAAMEEALREGGAVEHEDPDLLFERAADAVAFGDLETLREMLDDEPALVHARSPRPHRATLLNYCGANGTESPRQRTPANAPAVAQLLLERGADPDAACKLYGGGSTTMGLMLTSCHPRDAGLDGELVRVLTRFGAKAHANTLMGAIEYGMPLSVQALVEAGVPIENLFIAAGLGRVDLMRDLLARGADVNARAWRYGTALHAAAAMGQKEAAAFLLDHGADPSLINVWESTPADTARYFGHLGVAELIDGHRRFLAR
jgi:ankyrin repeat protein